MSLRSKAKYSGLTIGSLILGLYLQTFGLEGASLLLASIVPTTLYWYENQDRFSEKKVKYKFYVGLGAIALTVLLLASLSMITYSM